jgi:hypothetical protein
MTFFSCFTSHLSLRCTYIFYMKFDDLSLSHQVSPSAPTDYFMYVFPVKDRSRPGRKCSGPHVGMGKGHVMYS